MTSPYPMQRITAAGSILAVREPRRSCHVDSIDVVPSSLPTRLMRISLPSFLAGWFAGCTLLVAQVQPTPARPFDEPLNRGSKVGVNAAEFNYYSPELVFTDLFRGCSEWIPQLING